MFKNREKTFGGGSRPLGFNSSPHHRPLLISAYPHS